MNMMPTLFGTSTCPACHQARQWLDAHRAYYVFRDVNADPTAAPTAAEMTGGQMSGAVPLLVVPGEQHGVIEGFHPEQYADLLRRNQTFRGDLVAFGARLGDTNISLVPSPVRGVISTVSSAVSAYHGYRRNDSIGWAVWWALMGAIFPIITPVVAIAQGYGRRRGRR